MAFGQKPHKLPSSVAAVAAVVPGTHTPSQLTAMDEQNDSPKPGRGFRPHRGIGRICRISGRDIICASKTAQTTSQSGFASVRGTEGAVRPELAVPCRRLFKYHKRMSTEITNRLVSYGRFGRSVSWSGFLLQGQISSKNFSLLQCPLPVIVRGCDTWRLKC